MKLKRVIALMMSLCIILTGVSSFAGTPVQLSVIKTSDEFYFSNKLIEKGNLVILKGVIYVPLESVLKCAKMNYKKEKNGSLIVNIYDSEITFDIVSKKILKNKLAISDANGICIKNNLVYVSLEMLFKSLEISSKVSKDNNHTKVALYPTIKLLNGISYKATAFSNDYGKGIEVQFSNFVSDNIKFWVGLSNEKYQKGKEIQQKLSWEKPKCASLIPSDDKTKGYNTLNTTYITFKKGNNIIRSFVLTSNWLFQRSILTVNEVPEFDNVEYELKPVGDKELESFFAAHPIQNLSLEEINAKTDLLSFINK